MRALRKMLPEATIPKPLHVHVEYFENAWHFEYPGSEVSLEEKRKQAANLSQLHPTLLGDSIFLVGEAYNPHRTWVEGALDSVHTALNKSFLHREELPKGRIHDVIAKQPVQLPAHQMDAA